MDPKQFTIPKVSVLAWEAAGEQTRPDYAELAAGAHDLSIAIGEQLGVVGPDSWMELPEAARTPLTIFAQRIIEERLGMSEFHDIWCEEMLSQGFSMGQEDSEEAKTHTLLVPYANLPAAATWALRISALMARPTWFLAHSITRSKLSSRFFLTASMRFAFS